MNAPTNVQVINGPDGNPAFVVIPYAEYVASHTSERNLVPHDVVTRTVGGASPARAWRYVASHTSERNLVPHDVVTRTVGGASPARAWREHLGLTQAEVAERLGISQPAYAQQERSDKLRKASRGKIAAALGIAADQLDF
ncbi:helix-turn-helix domain-containing protein [Cupriavidus basilensis]|uniref:helix-turn-helix domain-containing protein n=1 Tax=Cupriavidus basilensis TaxID=68895 RepID=UPI0039F65D96